MIMNRMRELVDRLNELAYQYYVLDNPTVADQEYDRLYDELVELEKKTKTIYDDSPTRKVGGPVLDKFSTWEHKHRLYSLDKCQNIGELRAWADRVKKALGYFPVCTVEYKFDGLSINLTYENKMLKTAATRGNGEVGENITEQAKTIKSLPLSIKEDGVFEIQGEGVMLNSVFEEYNKTAEIPLKNPRNAAAGAIRNLDPKVTKERKLDFFAYNINYSEKEYKSQEEIYKFLKVNRFLVDDYFKIAKNVDEIAKYLKEIEEVRNKLDVQIDGAVIKINDISLREKLGYTEKFPRWAIAYKFKADEATTTVRDVIWQISRTGKLNPLAILDPVEISGATVRRATLSNISEIKRKDIRIGSKVFIRRSNDVIPEITAIAKHTAQSKEIEPPKVCPACGTELVYDDIFIYCPNTVSCAPRIISALSHFATKDGMDIEGLSEKTLELLFNELKVRNFSDIYKLEKENLLNLEGFQEKKSQNLILSIEKSKKVSLNNFIFALGIPNIGKKAAKLLKSYLKGFENIKNATKEELMQIPDFGDIMAQSLVDYFKNDTNLKEIDELFRLGVEIKQEDETKKEGVFSGEKVVLTGSLEEFTRSEAGKIIENLGGEVLSSVTKQTTLVIYGEKSGSKLDKAKKLNIKLMNENEFKNTIKNKD